MTPERSTPTRVLVVDDLALFRHAIAALIDGEDDLEVVGEADNGLDAVELARQLAPDVIVMDVEMPVMDGLGAAARIREHVPAAKIVMLTVAEDDEHLMEAVALGVHGYLLKDLRPDQLFDMIRAVTRGETPVSPALVTRLLAALRETGGARPQWTAPQTSRPEDALSHRELEILQLVAEGLSNKEIGSRLSITEGTVKNHVHHALGKLNMDNRIQAAAYVVRQGLGASVRRHAER